MHATESQPGQHEKTAKFQSTTHTFLQSEISTHIRCPRCGARINFRQGVEWHGPDHFSRGTRNGLIGKGLVLRSLRDLRPPE